MSEQLVPTGERVKLIERLFKANGQRIVRAVPRTTGDPQRLLTIAFNTIIYDPKLAQCTHQSLLGGVMEALKLGITIGGPMQESWLIPFRNKKKNDKGEWTHVMEATMIVGFQGYRNIIDRGRSVLDLHPRAVHKDDVFEYEFGSRPRITHRPCPKGAPVVKGDLFAVYAVANLRGGGQQMEVLELPEIEAHRLRSRAKDSGPWANEHDYVPMAMKTAIRKIVKYLPKSSEILARALDLDDRADKGEDQNFDLPEGAEFFDADPAPPTSSVRLADLTKTLSPATETIRSSPFQAARVMAERDTPRHKDAPTSDLSADDIFGE